MKQNILFLAEMFPPHSLPTCFVFQFCFDVLLCWPQEKRTYVFVCSSSNSHLAAKIVLKSSPRRISHPPEMRMAQWRALFLLVCSVCRARWFSRWQYAWSGPFISLSTFTEHCTRKYLRVRGLFDVQCERLMITPTKTHSVRSRYSPQIGPLKKTTPFRHYLYTHTHAATRRLSPWAAAAELSCYSHCMPSASRPKVCDGVARLK